MGVELLYSSVKTEVKTVGSCSRVGDGGGKESHTRPKGPSGTPMEFGDQRRC